MVSILLVSTILLISVNASASLLSNSTQQRNSNLGASLAAQFVDEISAMDFRDRVEPRFGLEDNEDASNRMTFDDVDDYHGHQMMPPTQRNGTTIDGFEEWSVALSVLPADPVDGGISTKSASENSPLRLIGVICTAPDGTTHSAATLVSDVPSNVDQSISYERWRRIELRFPDRNLNVSAPLRNQPASITPLQ